MKLNQNIMAFTMLILFFGTIGIAQISGIWTTQNTRTPARIASGRFEGVYNPADIRGSHLFGDISALFEIPLEDLGRAFAIDDEGRYATFSAGDLEGLYKAVLPQDIEVGTGTVRVFTAWYKGLPIETEEGLVFPDTAVAVLLEKGDLTEAQRDYLMNPEYIVSAIVVGEVAASSPRGDGRFIGGRTTFREVVGHGIKLEDIEAALDVSVPNVSMIIRDFCAQNGLNFSEVRDAIEALRE